MSQQPIDENVFFIRYEINFEVAQEGQVIGDVLTFLSEALQ